MNSARPSSGRQRGFALKLRVGIGVACGLWALVAVVSCRASVSSSTDLTTPEGGGLYLSLYCALYPANSTCAALAAAAGGGGGSNYPAANTIVYVAVTSANGVYYQTKDNLSAAWNNTALAGPPNLRSVAYGDGFFVAGDQTGNIWYAPISNLTAGGWNSVNIAGASGVRGVAFVDVSGVRYFIAVDSTGVVRYASSATPNLWNAAGSAGIACSPCSFSSIAYVNDRLVISNGIDTAGVFGMYVSNAVSANLGSLSWTSIHPDSAAYYHIVFGAGRLSAVRNTVTLQSNSTVNVITPAWTGLVATNLPGTGGVVQHAFGGGYLVAGTRNNSGSVSYSTDGLSWSTALNIAGTATMRYGLFGYGRFIFGTTTPQGIVATTVDDNPTAVGNWVTVPFTGLIIGMAAGAP